MVCSSTRGQGWGVGGRGLQTREAREWIQGCKSGIRDRGIHCEREVGGRWEVRRDVRGDWRRQCFSVPWLGKRGVVEV